MEKNENLYNHVSSLCEVLNENNIKHTFFNGKEQTLIKWEADKENPSATFLGGICWDSTAFDYLKKYGYLDNGVCWRCGAEPISNEYIFTDAFNKNVKFFICKSCYNSGNKMKQKPRIIMTFLKFLIYAFIIYLVIKLFALLF